MDSVEQRREQAWLAESLEDEAFEELLQRQEAARRCCADSPQDIQESDG